MGDRARDPRVRTRVLIVCTFAALAGGVLAATVTSAQGPGDYQPTTTTTTTTVTTGPTTLPAPSPEVDIRLKLKGTKGKQKIKGSVVVTVKARIAEDRAALRQAANSIFVSAHGKLALKVEPGGQGKRCRNKPKGSDRRFKLGNDFKTIANGGKTKLKLSIPKKAKKLVESRAICKDTKAKAKVRITARDDQSNRAKKERVIKMFPRNR